MSWNNVLARTHHFYTELNAFSKVLPSLIRIFLPRLYHVIIFLEHLMMEGLSTWSQALALSHMDKALKTVVCVASTKSVLIMPNIVSLVSQSQLALANHN